MVKMSHAAPSVLFLAACAALPGCEWVAGIGDTPLVFPQAQTTYIKASNTGGFDFFGGSISLSRGTLAIGAVSEDSAATGIEGDQANNAAEDSGAVYVFRKTDERWVQEAYIKASNTGAHDRFFNVSLSGDTLAVGAEREDSAATGINGNQADDSAEDSGAVYVFRRTGTSWVQEAYLKASEATGRFGGSVSLSGNTLAVGAPRESAGGAVYVFRRTGTAWSQEVRVKGSNVSYSDDFGTSVSLSGDSLAVGSWGDDSPGTEDNRGAVYVFRRTDTAWEEQAYLHASNAEPGDRFGGKVSLSGNILAVSSTSEDSAATGVDGDQNDNTAVDSGAVYVFRRTGTDWSQEAYIKASNTDAEDHFGIEVALSGRLLAVGAEFEGSNAVGIDGDQTDNASTRSGAAYIFRRVSTTWVQETYLKASNTNAYDYFGTGLALSDGILAVGASTERSAATGVEGDQADTSARGSGAVYIFE